MRKSKRGIEGLKESTVASWLMVVDALLAKQDQNIESIGLRELSRISGVNPGTLSEWKNGLGLPGDRSGRAVAVSIGLDFEMLRLQLEEERKQRGHAKVERDHALQTSPLATSHHLPQISHGPLYRAERKKVYLISDQNGLIAQDDAIETIDRILDEFTKDGAQLSEEQVEEIFNRVRAEIEKQPDKTAENFSMILRSLIERIARR